jgi:CDP-diacylglycerol--glycerol-3-phosphate 3-phosphatidyltransferase
MKRVLESKGRAVLEPAVRGLVALRVSPTAITLVGLALHAVGGAVIGFGRPRLGVLVLVVAALCDALDGQVARRSGRTTRFGAFLDSNVDRIEEAFVLAGVSALFQRTEPEHGPLLAVLVLLALAGSIITSYARARAEGLGLECKVGLFERPERVVVTLVGLLAGGRVLVGAVALVLVLSWVTVLQRILHVHRLLAAPGPGPGGRGGSEPGT